MNLNVGKTDQFGSGFLCQLETLALSSYADIGAADFFAEISFFPYAGIHFLAEFNIGSETACRDNDPVLSHQREWFAVVVSLDSDNSAVLHDQFGCRRFQIHTKFVFTVFLQLFF